MNKSCNFFRLFMWVRHGIRQLRSGWADGPAYITQCPIQTGQSYVYNYTIIGQRGTLFWHAHISWLRSTLYGPIIILPKHGVPYPFAKPYEEFPILFGNVFILIQVLFDNDFVLTLNMFRCFSKGNGGIPTRKLLLPKLCKRVEVLMYQTLIQ